MRVDRLQARETLRSALMRLLLESEPRFGGVLFCVGRRVSGWVPGVVPGPIGKKKPHRGGTKGREERAGNRRQSSYKPCTGGLMRPRARTYGAARIREPQAEHRRAEKKWPRPSAMPACR